ncbi:MAG: fibronectin type III domain-containing protein [Pyrinomonadaceae bacterium]|nr:fibronectin type III domain-containing protein [Pyrinomonadaceae bacterium]
MSKRIARRRKKEIARPLRKSRRKLLALISIIIGLGLSIAIAAKMRALPGMTKPATASPPGNFNANSPSKEYIYAGGRLIATEEPASSSSSLSAPTAFSATTVSSAQINLTWTAPNGAVDHYIVERSQSVGGSFTQLTPNPTTTSFTDNGVTSGVAYLYRVRAVDSVGLPTAASNLDLATAITFTDDPLVANSTVIKAQHLVELRQAVDAVRVLAGLQAATWTDPSPQGVFIKKLHIEELRANLDQALTALSLSTQSYTDPTLTTATAVKKVHFDELRQRVK